MGCSPKAVSSQVAIPGPCGLDSTAIRLSDSFSSRLLDPEKLEDKGTILSVIKENFSAWIYNTLGNERNVPNAAT